MHSEFTQVPRIAYFSMEVALRADIPTYAGGLGILAGDTLRSAADLDLPMVMVSLVSRRGYFRQELDARGRQLEHPDDWDPSKLAAPLHAKVSVPIAGRSVWIGGFLYVFEGYRHGRLPVILLDTDLEENSADDRRITDVLYGGDAENRLKQEIVLGIGGVRLLHALGFRIRQYHMNEGHSALLTLELLRLHAYVEGDVAPNEPLYDLPRVRRLCSFTTHTPIEAAHDKFPYALVDRVLDDFVERSTLQAEAGVDALNMTQLAVNLSEYINGVAKRHAETSQRMFPGHHVRAVTNGVHPRTWTCPSFARLYDAHIPDWWIEPELLVRADCCISPAEIRDAHAEAKQALLQLVLRTCGVTLDLRLPTIGFARRMTEYKRPDLLFTDLDRLRRIAQHTPFQLVLAGKAHPHDDAGKQLIELLHQHMRELAPAIPIVYLPNYDMAIAAALVAGVDVWLNTPLPPQEASGTSGMKAAFNAVPSLSVLDGWWVEGCVEGVTGWAVGNGSKLDAGSDAESLYSKLEGLVLPLYYEQPQRWLAVMQGAIAKNAPYFNSQRMMRRYAADAYLR
ncbi:MAG TPA: alpha-glucan family phosphorylase [Polyangiales bacterium]|nr:alpha-glucan family phosphorylase [Polyangiales bacterium]